MDVAIYRKSDNVLESHHNGSVPHCPLVRTSIPARRYMRDEYSDFPVIFHPSKGVFEPLQLVAWIIFIRPKEHIPVVAGLSSHSNNSNLLVACTITGLQQLTVITCCSILFKCIFIQIILPLLHIERNHGILFFEVLTVWNSKVMVAFDWINCIIG